MKKKIVGISVILILLIIVLIFYFEKTKDNNKKNSLDANNISNVTDIDTNIETNSIKDVDFSKLSSYDIKLVDTLKITSGGVYNLTGKLENGQIYIDTKDSVKLILDNVDITSKNGPAIMVENADQVYIELKSNSVNYLQDTPDYDVDLDGEPNATIFSKDDLVLAGDGKLVIDANYKDGIVSKDNLKILDGEYEIDALDDAIRGKDSLVINNGNFLLNASGDGLKATNNNDSNLGYILIEDGNFEIVSNNDGISTESDLVINNGVFKIETGGGSVNSSTESSNWGHFGNPFNETTSQNTNNLESAKGLKAGKSIVIKNGEFTIDSADDAIHSNEYVGIADGEFIINSGDDGIHADSELIIDSGKIDIQKSYEGIEAESISINGGDISIISTDDGLNAAGGNDSSSIDGRMGMNQFAGNGNSQINLNGGNIFVESKGDGIDANGSIYLTGGTVIVNGPVDSGNGALDYDREFKITGGVLIASGSSGMAQGVSNTSTQTTININFSKTIDSFELVSIFEDDSEILTYESSKQYQNLIISTPNLKSNTNYTIYTGGSSSRDNNNGLYEIGGYKKGSEYTNFDTTDIITNVGNSLGMNNGMKPGMHGPVNRR